MLLNKFKLDLNALYQVFAQILEIKKIYIFLKLEK